MAGGSQALMAGIALAIQAHASPTFTKDVAPVLYRHCVSCHRPDNIAPMSLLDYKSARPWAKSIRQAVAIRKMPPWFADPEWGRFSNDARLTADEIETIRAWADGGAKEGDPADLPRPPAFTEGWQAGTPDVVIDIGEDHVVTPGEDAYEHFIVPTGLTQGHWIRAAEIHPGNRAVVHHAHALLVEDDPAAMQVASTLNMPGLRTFLIREGKLTRVRMDAPVVNDACADSIPSLPYLTGFQEGALASFLPGRPPDVFSPGTAKWLPPNRHIEFVIHYARIAGKPQTDRTQIGLYFAPEPDRILRRMDLRNFFLSIPPGAPNQEVRRCYDFETDKLLLSFTPHMHYRGKDMRYELIHPDGRTEVVLSVPHYDFNWQLTYRLAVPVRAEQGSKLIVTAHYDNSPNNRANPDPARLVRWGDKSEEEMMTSWIEYIDAPR
jgi:hypothetical protein